MDQCLIKDSSIIYNVAPTIMKREEKWSLTHWPPGILNEILDM